MFGFRDIEYVKSYVMELELEKLTLKEPELPAGFVWIAWQERLADVFARVQYLGFRGEVDSQVFPTFRRYDSCLRLVRQIGAQAHFYPPSSWLVGREVGTGRGAGCGMIQCSRTADDFSMGRVENIAVLSEDRHQGVGRALLVKALIAFHKGGCRRVRLEATAQNHEAIRLYNQLGFKITKVSYKETYVA